MTEPVIHEPMTKRELVRELKELSREIERKYGACKGRSGKHHLRGTKMYLDCLIDLATPRRRVTR